MYRYITVETTTWSREYGPGIGRGKGVGSEVQRSSGWRLMGTWLKIFDHSSPKYSDERSLKLRLERPLLEVPIQPFAPG